MPSIASQVQAAMKPVAQQPQALPAPDRGAPSTFESMLDDTAQATAPQSPPDNSSASKAADADQSQQTTPGKDAPAQDADSKSAAASTTDKSSTPAKTDKADKADTADDGKKPGDAQAAAKGKGDAKTDPKTDAKIDAKTDAKTVTDAAAANALTTPDAGKPASADPVAAALPAPVAVQVTVTQAQGIVAGAATPTLSAPAVAATALVAAAAAPAAKAAPAAAPGKADAKGKADVVLAQQADVDAAGDAKGDTKAGAPAQADGKPATTDDKPATAPAHAGADHVALDAQPAPVVSPQAAAAKAGGDTVQPLAMNAPAQQAQAPAAASAPAAQIQQLPAQAVPLAGLGLEIAGKALAGKNHFDIRLDPPELGRIEVRLDVGRDGSISSHVIADRKDTLDLLQRDASGLQRAFEDAGLKTSDQGMQFSLRDQYTGQQQQNAPSAGIPQPVVEDETPLAALPIDYNRIAAARGGLDIRV